jgi:hypothetical protein
MQSCKNGIWRGSICQQCPALWHPYTRETNVTVQLLRPEDLDFKCYRDCVRPTHCSRTSGARAVMYGDIKMKHKETAAFKWYMFQLCSRDSLVSIVTRQRTGPLGFHSQQGRDFFLFATAYRPALGPSQRPGLGAEHLLPSRTAGSAAAASRRTANRRRANRHNGTDSWVANPECHPYTDPANLSSPPTHPNSHPSK